MLEYYTYKCKLLDLFLKSLGGGFPEIINNYNPKLKSNNMKQKINAMYAGNVKAYNDIFNSIDNCIRAFTEGELSDKSTLFSEENASDKYWTSFNELFHSYFFSRFQGDFFYESTENIIAYFIAKNFYTEGSCENYTTHINTEKSEERTKYMEKPESFVSPEDYKKYLEWFNRCFRPEYETSISDVRFNKKENKTFYKWPIKEFKKSIGENEVFNEILEIVFPGETGISKNFGKLSTDSRKRNWAIFEKLFKNELKNQKLMEVLNKNDKYLAAYEVFQSRMFVANFLENLCYELANFVGEENTKELVKIITGTRDRKKPEDFLIPNHEEKTNLMMETFLDVWQKEYESFEVVTQAMEKFDRNCPATKVFMSYFNMTCRSLRCAITDEQYYEADKLIRQEHRFFENNGLQYYDIQV